MHDASSARIQEYSYSYQQSVSVCGQMTLPILPVQTTNLIRSIPVYRDPRLVATETNERPRNCNPGSLGSSCCTASGTNYDLR